MKPQSYIIAVKGLGQAIDALQAILFPAMTSNPEEARSILLEEATLLINWVMEVPDPDNLDPSYFQECQYSDLFSRVGDELVRRPEWQRIVAHHEVSFLQVIDRYGSLLIHVDQGEFGGHSRLPQFRECGQFRSLPHVHHRGAI